MMNIPYTNLWALVTLGYCIDETANDTFSGGNNTRKFLLGVQTVTSSIGRRNFLKMVGAGAGAVGAATLIGARPAAAQEHEMTPEATMVMGGEEVAEMDAHHSA